MNKKDEIQSIKKKVASLTKRLDKVEDRLIRLERPSGSRKKQRKKSKSKSKKSSKKSSNKSSNPSKKSATDHNYLKKTIDDAKERYEKEHKI